MALTNTDIIEALPILAGHREKANSGSTTTLVSLKLTDLLETDMVGAIIGFLNGPNNGIEKVISSYNTATGEFGFEALQEPVDSTTVFCIIYLDYFSYTKRAYDIITSDLHKKGLDIELFLDSTQLKELHLTKTLQLICIAKRQDAETTDIYHEDYLFFTDKYATEFNNLTADYDKNDDGVIDDGEANITAPQISFGKQV